MAKEEKSTNNKTSNECESGKCDSCECKKGFCKPWGHHHKGKGGGACGGAVYGIGLIGAAIYFIQHADSFWMGVLGILKAIAWPALFVYKFLEFLKF